MAPLLGVPFPSILDLLFFFLASVSEYRRMVISSLARSPHSQFPRNLSSPLIVRFRHVITPPLEIENALLPSFYPLSIDPDPFPWQHAKLCTVLSTYILPIPFYDLHFLFPVSFIYF